ncbi:protoporphyrinogen oxidase [Motiliproteus sp. SC1-56]|uniref:protoporphyrinogen oxidase n=1 Tax=Motiliproteus sp. SC1-56 TaxID=2799565 RepID=UPI001A8F6D99|nr:protoporphyrinogen oxidase [Motiliproteus sp. SC1-56]
MSRSYLIVGGGISGLSTAWFLRQRGHRVTLLEAREEAGGNLRTEHRNGFLIERGPNSTLNNRPALGTLFDGLGITPVEANAASKKRYVLRDGQLHALPMSPGSFIRTPLFSASGKLRLLAEPFIGRAPNEESVAEFVERRLGREFLDWAINPFVSGVYAGDPAQLSARAATAKVYALERDHRSLILGMINRMLFHKHRGGAGPSGKMISFADGMQVLAARLQEVLGEDLQCGVRVDSVQTSAQGWQVRSGERTWEADDLVLSLPAAETAALLAPLDPAFASPLQSIEYPHVASVSLGFARQAIKHPLDGFGFLIPRRTGVETLGVLFPSSIFAGRAPADHCLLTCFIGGALNPELGSLDDDEVKRRVLRDITPLLGISGDPALCSVNRWPRAIPQYSLGHLQRLESLEKIQTRFPGLHLRANWRDGISVADCVQNGHDFAQGQD